jgi:hypothetical protein
MTKLDKAIVAVRSLPQPMQDQVAEAMLALAGAGEVYALSPEERAAVNESDAEIERGEFASDEDVRAVWAKYGL